MAEAQGGIDRASGRKVLTSEEPRKIIPAIERGEVDAVDISGSRAPRADGRVKLRDADLGGDDRLDMALRAADMGIWEYDFQTGDVHRDLRHDQMFGYDQMQPTWRRRIARGHFLPEDRAVFDAAFERAVVDGHLQLEGRVRWPDGSVHWLRTIGRTYYDDAGQPVRMVGVVMDETDRHRSADALRDSQARFRLLADAMPQLAWTARPDGEIDYLNQRASEYAGLVERDGTWAWEEALHPDDRETTRDRWRRAVERGEVYEVEHRLRASAGEPRWHISRAVPLKQDDGGVVRWYGTSTDIHDVKTAQAEIQASRERLEVALEAAEMGTWETDFIAGTSHRSLRHDQIFGYEGLQPDWGLEVARSHVLPEDLEAFDRAVEEGERTGKLRHEVRIRRPDGSVRWILSLGRYYYDASGTRVRRAGVLMDVTERKEAEQALRMVNETLEEEVARRTVELQAARDHFRTAFEGSPTASAIVDLRSGRLLDVNGEFASFFGYQDEPIAGLTIDELGLWGDALERARILRLVGRRVSIRNEEVRARVRDGEIRIVLVSVEPIALGEGPCALVMFMDITERKKAEDAVRRLSSALTLAEQRERRRLSQVLHDDLQQMLFAVEMRAAVLRQSVAATFPPDGQNALIEHIDDLKTLVTRAVRTTRVLAIELNPPILSGEGLAPALVWLSRHMEEMHGLVVQLALDDDLQLPLEDQRVLIVQLAKEVLFNVVKHSGREHAALSAKRDGERLVVRVADDGVGFDVEQMMARRAARDSLGLFSVEERLRLFGGRLEINSCPGAGTVIEIHMPLSRPV